MIGKEILEYGKKIVDLKRNIEDSYNSEPDLEETINTKFSEDTVNRAKFVDSTLVIGGVATEFRNVFGVEAPHYEISKCHIGINKRGLVNGQYQVTDRLSISDPMQEGNTIIPEEELSSDKNADPDKSMDPKINQSFRSFLDCWEMINAARFDSQTEIKNFDGDTLALPVNKQRFFVDADKGNSGSSIYKPFCPPGYDKWAGNKVYDYICKNFELDELALFKILYNGDDCTVKGNYAIDYNGDIDSNGNFINAFIPNNLRSEYGRICNGNFTYSFDASNNSFLLGAQENGEYGMPHDGCTPHDEEKVTYITCNVPVNSIKIGDKYYYSYDRRGTIFEKTRTPLVSFKLNDINVTEWVSFIRGITTITNVRDEFNSGYAILCEDPFQELPEYGSQELSSYPLRFTFNVIYSRNNIWNRGAKESWTETYTVQDKNWLGRVKNVEVRTREVSDLHPYRLTISPIKISTNLDLRSWLVKYVKELEDDCINYYEFTNERGVKNNIPDIERSMQKMVAVRDAANVWLNDKSTDNFNSFISVLGDRVLYDVFMDNYNDSQKNLFKLTTTEESNFVEARKEGDFSYVSYYITKTTGWWFWKKTTRTPVYATGHTLSFNFSSVTRNIENRVKRSFISSAVSRAPSATVSTSSSWFGLSQSSSSSVSKETTLYYLLNAMLNASQKQALRDYGYLRDSDRVLTIGGVNYKVNNSDVYAFNIVTGNEERLPFDNIKRAQVLNYYLENNPELYAKIFYIAMARINKRNGTLREVCNLAESTTAINQMTSSKIENVSDLFDYLNAYTISGGYGNNVITIKLATWESDDMAYSTLERLSTVYILCDGTAIDPDDGSFTGPYWVKTKITEIIDKVSDPIIEYVLIDESENVRAEKEYYIQDPETATYKLVTGSDVEKYTRQELFRKSITSGPIFRVTLQDILPENFINKNPILVKVC